MSEELAIEPVETVTDAPAEVTETPEPSEAQTDETAEAPAEAKEEQKPELTEADKIRHAMQKRIDRLTAKSSAAEQQLQEVMERLKQFDQPKTNDAPKEEDFETVEDYLKAVGKWEAKQEFARAEQDKAAQTQKQAFEARMTEKRASFEAKEAELRKATPDYDDAVQVLNEYIETVDQKSPGFQVFRDVMMESEDMAAMSYHLGKNPEIVEKLSKSNPIEVARILFNLERDLKETPKKAAQVAPKPPTAIKAQGVDKAEDLMSGKELLKRHKLI